MSLKLPYKKYPSKDGGFDLYAALGVHIALPGKNAPRSKRFEAIIDSGANRTTIHADIGRALGLEVEKGIVDEAYGISGKVSVCYLHDVSLYLPGGIIGVQVAFTPDLPVAGLLGMRGFFEFFKVVFDPTAQGCEIDRVYQA